jgi:hypothetical protein
MIDSGQDRFPGIDPPEPLVGHRRPGRRFPGIDPWPEIWRHLAERFPDDPRFNFARPRLRIEREG